MAFLRFKQWLDELNRPADPIDRVFFEEVRAHRGTIASHVYGGFLAHLSAWCEYHEVPYEGAPVAVIKRHATGRGNAGKEQMIEAMRRLEFNPADDSEADALALLHRALEHRAGGGGTWAGCAFQIAASPRHENSSTAGCGSP